MIKQIQLRGISRSPSDRMTSDGGCSESMNVITDSSELAPMPAPEDISEDMALYGVAGEILYIHRSGEMYRNVIVRDGSRVVAYSKDGVAQELYSGADDVRINDVKSLGNILLVIINGQMNYFLYIGGKYEETSGWDKLPEISFESIPIRSGHVPETLTTGTLPVDSYTEVEAIKRHNGNIEQKYVSIYNENCHPRRYRIFRYSILLYDGKEILSGPVVFCTRDEYIQEFIVDMEGASCRKDNGVWVITQDYSYRLALFEQNKIKVHADFPYEKSINRDLVRGIRIYCSIEFGETVASAERDSARTIECGIKGKYVSSFEAIKPFTCKKPFSEDVSKVDVRLIKTYLFDAIENKDNTPSRTDPVMSEVSPISKLFEGDVITFPDNDTLETQPEINFDLEYVPGIGSFSRMIVYNQKLIGVGNSSVPNVSTCPLSVIETDETSSTKRYYMFTFEMVEPITGKTDIVKARDTSGNTVFSPDSGKMPLGIVYFPSAKCRTVYITAHNGEPAAARKRKYTMVEHPTMTGYSYALLDNTLSKDLWDILGDTSTGTAFTTAPEETQTENGSQKLFVSELGNPFVFSAAGVFSFDDEILGVATTTKALSSGQFGQFPLYVFTKGGIWSMETASDGSFTTKKPLSRDVALSSECITPIDQSVVFTTDKGVMLLSGSEVTNLSPFMTGKHYTADSEITSIAKKIEGFDGLVPSISDKTSFMDFMREARCAYDYSGSRLIFFNGKLSYQYVYKIDTQTWHKMDMGDAGNTLDRGKDYFFITLTTQGEKPSNTSVIFQYCWDARMNFLLPLKEWDTAGRFGDGIDVPIGYVNTLDDAEYIVRGLNGISGRNFFAKYHTFDDNGEGYSTQYSILNSYPDCRVGISVRYLEDGAEGAYFPMSRILNLSTTFDADKVTPLKGIIITRPFDLDEADVRKVLKSVRIRGNHTRGKVVYVLEASMDGIHWGRIPSLRSGSFKLFRIVIFANLDAYERISYIETDYDTVFTDRLR